MLQRQSIDALTEQKRQSFVRAVDETDAKAVRRRARAAFRRFLKDYLRRYRENAGADTTEAA
jgi:hypothetical protein